MIGVGPVGLRTAELLQREGAEVTMFTFPPDVMEGGYRRASGVPVAQEAGFEVVEPASSDELDAALAGRAVVFAAGPAGTQILRRSGWAQDGVRVVVDYSAAEPVGVEGVDRGDDLEEEDGVMKLGALAVGGPKMKLQKACIRSDVRDQGHGAGPRGRLRRRPRSALSDRLERPASYFENTNLPIGPSSGPSASGRHRIVSSILRASVKSLSVIPPAECVASLTQSLPQVTFRSA